MNTLRRIFPSFPTLAAFFAVVVLSVGALIVRKAYAYGSTEKFSYLAGAASATVTIPANQYATAVMVHSTAGATMTIAPGNAGVAPVTGPTITIPANTGWTLPVPVIQGNVLELGPQSVITMGSGVDAYFIAIRTGGN